MFNKLRKVAISVVTSGALVLALGGGLASTAAAQGPLPRPATVEADNLGNIHLTKYEDSTNRENPNGTQNQDISQDAKPVKGIEFTLTRIVATPEIANVSDVVKTGKGADLKKLAALTGPAVEKALADGATNWDFEKISAELTDERGQIDWEDLQLGVYLLQETNSVVTLDDGTTKAYKSSPASLVFLPTTDPVGDLTNLPNATWIYEDVFDQDSNYAVWVYPKNSVEENLKTVDAEGKQVGDTVTYTISSSVPAVHALAADQKPANYTNTYDLNNFGFWDNLSENLQLLNTDDVTVKVGVPTADGKAPDNATALKADDFVAKVYKSGDKIAPVADTTDGGQKLVVLLTPAGLEKVATAKHNDTNTKVFLTFAPKVIKSGIAANKAQVYKSYVGEAESLPTDDVPFSITDVDLDGNNTFDTNTAVAIWGKLDLLKTDEKDTPTPLPGAKFKVFATTDEQGSYDSTKPLTVDTKNEFVTDSQGRLTIDGLGVGKYVLVETEAPAGYELARAPFPFNIDVPEALQTAIDKKTNWNLDDNGDVTTANQTITDANALVAADMNADGVLETTDTNAALHRKVTVVNIPVKPRLPLTGGAGIAIFGLLGGGLLLGGLYAAKRNSRQA